MITMEVLHMFQTNQENKIYNLNLIKKMERINFQLLVTQKTKHL